MIKIRLDELVAAEPALTRVMQTRLPAKTAYRLSGWQRGWRYDRDD